MNLELGFECDRDAKLIAGRAMVEWGKSLNCTIHTAMTTGSTDRVDLFYTAITPSNKMRFGMVEVKERPTTQPGKYPNEFVNREKLENEEVRNYLKSGFTYLWCSVYTDYDEYYIWNTADTVREADTRFFRRKTVEQSPVVQQTRWHLDFNRAKINGKISDLPL